mgnify:CR=1 FL=1
MALAAGEADDPRTGENSRKRFGTPQPCKTLGPCHATNTASESRHTAIGRDCTLFGLGVGKDRSLWSPRVFFVVWILERGLVSAPRPLWRALGFARQHRLDIVPVGLIVDQNQGVDQGGAKLDVLQHRDVF